MDPTRLGSIVKPEGLRERKKRQTETAIELAGIELALESGLETVTVAKICDRAEVSRSTFFNYMPSLEAAIFGRPYPRLVPGEVAAMLDAAEGLPLSSALLGVVMSVIENTAVNPEVAGKRYQLMQQHPETQILVRGPLTQVFDDLADVAGDWLEAHPERQAGAGPARREAKLLVGIVGMALEDLLLRLSADGGLQDVELSPADWVEAIANIAHLAGSQVQGIPGSGL